MSLLEVTGLTTQADSPRLGLVTTVDAFTASVAEGEILGIVGESGAGKTVLLRTILGILNRNERVAAGEIRFRGELLPVLDDEAMRPRRGASISLIQAGQRARLDPVRRVGDQLLDVMAAHDRVPRPERGARAEELLRSVGIPDARHQLRSYPHELSGGMSATEARRRTLELLTSVGIRDPEQRLGAYPHQMSGGMNQRITIAMALAAEPELLIADEPTTALDVTVQAQICALLRTLVDDTGVSVIFISHDLDLVTEFCDRVAVMYAGAVVEVGDSRRLKRQPRHPYTRALFAAIPGHRPPFSQLEEIPGEIVIHGAEPIACGFAPRCPRRLERCTVEVPPLIADGEGGRLACFNPHGVRA
jgi:peptide/nickel transport system ATP-binding protein